MFRLPVLRIGSRFCSTSTKVKEILSSNASEVDSVIKRNMPVQMSNPFAKEKKFCILCKYKIQPDYKNIRLLSQFISRFTGRVYGRHITGLCKKQQLNVELAVKRAQIGGLMSSYYRDPRFSHDPKLFDPDNPFRPHRY